MEISERVQELTEFPSLKTCPACGGRRFARVPILWDALIKEWDLSPAEVHYIDLQQGLSCLSCKNNLRSMTLAAAVNSALSHPGTFEDLCANDARFRALTLIEINEAGALTQMLKLLPNYTLCAFPQFDLQRMALKSDSVDIIIHSDTLEHVPDPVTALRECWRLLKNNGHLFYTVPIILRRLTKRRHEGLPASYHGSPETQAEALRVRTEYGADFWCELFEAGFQKLILTSLVYPASVAIHATKTGE